MWKGGRLQWDQTEIYTAEAEPPKKQDASIYMDKQ